MFIRIFIGIYCLLLLPITYAQDKLVFALDLIRHGDRTPIHAISTTPSAWQENPGALTPKGMQQEYQLGRSLRKLYVEKYSLLAKNYTPQTVFVASSNVDRTLMSAQAVLLGLYPLGTGPLNDKKPALPIRYQPIPIHIFVNESVLKINHQDPKLQKLWQAEFLSSKIYQAKEEEYQKKLVKWSSISKMKINYLWQVTALGDNLRINLLYKIPLPKGISFKEAQEIIQFSSWVASYSASLKPISLYASFALRQLIANYLRAATKLDNRLKYVLLSSHDTTLMAFLSAIAYPLNQIPPYASDVQILLFKTNAKTKSYPSGYYISLKYNQQRITLKPGLVYYDLNEFLGYLNQSQA